MRCPKCGADNREVGKFCAKCGAPLARSCPQCGASNEPGEDFCGECGTALRVSAVAASAKKSSNTKIRVADTFGPEDLEGERKTVTVLFADIKGSMDLIEDLDPEDARAIVDPALKLMMVAVQRNGGYVAQSTGDGILALFGAPVAHEDHPQRALHTALRMQGELRRYSDQLRERGQAPLSIRVGVNTGEVVVRTIKTGEAHTEYLPIGHSTAVAARLEALAAPGSIVISESVRKLVEGYFALKPLGPARIKGISEPLEIYEVTGLGKLRTRFQRAAARGYTKFAGRQREMETMKDTAELAKAGNGQIVAVVGEAGVGKSRLFHEFKATNQSGWLVLEAFSVLHGKATAYRPVIELLNGYFRIAPEDDQRTRREKVNRRIVTLDPALEDARPYLFGLLGLIEGDDPLTQIDGQIRRRRTQVAIKRILLRESLNQPVMLVFEDLHQIDEETQALLNLLADSIGTSRVLLLVNYRPEYSHSWGGKTYYTQVRLDPLGKESADEMLSTLLGDDESVAPLKRLIAEKTEGNPLFMEEIYQALIEEGVLVRNGAVKIARPLNALKIPTTVQAILTARIDRLPAGQKDLLENLAVIGKDFRLGLVGKVVARPNEELERTLAELQLAEFIYEQPAAGDIAYRFKHQLTREAAYNLVLVERRKALHERVAHAIEELNANTLGDHLADLAHHYERSGNHAKAVDYLRKAAKRSRLQSANEASLSQLKNALDLIGKMEASGEREEVELEVLLEYLSVVGVTNRCFTSEAGLLYERARRLCERSGQTSRLYRLLRGSATFHLGRGEPSLTQSDAKRILDLSASASKAEWAIYANYLQGHALCCVGRLAEAHARLVEAIGPQDSLTSSQAHGGVRIYSLGTDALVLWMLGYPDRALASANAAVNSAYESANDYEIAFALTQLHILIQFRREYSKALEVADRALKKAIEKKFEFLQTSMEWSRDACRILAGADRDISAVQSEFDRYFASEAQIYGPHNCTVLAECCAVLGQTELGLTMIDEAISSMNRSDQRMTEPETWRVKGVLLQNKASTPARSDLQRQAALREAEECYRNAITLARAQESKIWELRATASLTRLLLEMYRKTDGQKQLREICGWFREGFDTPDFQQAIALLQ